MTKVIVPLILIYLVFSIFGDISDALHGIEKTTIYQESCSTTGDVFYGVFECEKNGGRTTVRKKEFRVDFRNQLVVDKSSFGYHDHCIVFDKDNWRCGVDKESDGWEVMTDGTYGSSIDTIVKDNKVIILNANVGVVLYWKQYFKNIFG